MYIVSVIDDSGFFPNIINYLLTVSGEKRFVCRIYKDYKKISLYSWESYDEFSNDLKNIKIDIPQIKRNKRIWDFPILTVDTLWKRFEISYSFDFVDL